MFSNIINVSIFDGQMLMGFNELIFLKGGATQQDGQKRNLHNRHLLSPYLRGLFCRHPLSHYLAPRNSSTLNFSLL